MNKIIAAWWPYREFVGGLLVLLSLMISPACLAAQAEGSESCQLMANHAQIDYGQHSRGQMLQRAPGAGQLPFGQREIIINAICQQPVVMKVIVRGASDGRQSFRFGQQGGLDLKVKNALLDGNPVMVQQENGRPQTELVLAPGDSLQPVSSNGLPLHGKAFRLQLLMGASMATDATRVSQELRLEEHLTFELMTQ